MGLSLNRDCKEGLNMGVVASTQNYKWKPGSIFVLIILMATLIPIFSVSNTSGDLIEPSAFLPHDEIFINGDIGFTKANGVVRGNGTKDHPYVIENWSINENLIDSGIWIKNTNKYFTIRNCKIYNRTSYNYKTYGIRLGNVKNGTIENNRIKSNYYGIYLYKSDMNTISTNICNYSRYAGVFLEFSDSNTIINTICKDNCNGIVLEHSNLNTIRNNSLLNNDEGLCVIDSKSNTINKNTLKSNTYDSIFMFNTESNVITDNNCVLNGRNGIHLWYSDFNSIITNIGTSNGYEGICLRDSDSNIIKYNTCYSNFYDGIGIEESNDNIITDNICNSNNNNGVVLYDSNSNTIVNNSCKLNKINGISIVRISDHSDQNTIENNLCSSNGVNGISCVGGEENTIIGSTCELNNRNGIYIQGNSNNIIDNYCYLNNDGIYLYNSNANEIRDNFCKSDYSGILLFDSNSNTLRENTMVLCGILINGKSLMNWNSHYIDTTNSVNDKPVYYWKDQTTGMVPGGAGEVILANCTDIRIFDQNVSNGSVGILLGFTANSIISNNTCSNNNLDGIRFYFSSRNKIDNCSIYSNSNYDFYFQGNSKRNFAINSSFDTLFFAESTSELIIKNYLHVQVNLLNNLPKSGADLLVKDNNRIIFASHKYRGNKQQTNQYGQIKWILITDRIYPGKTPATENVTYVTTWYDDIPIFNNSRKVNMSTSHFEYFYLDNLLPTNVVLKSPANNSFTNVSAPKLSWYAGTDRNHDPLTYYVQVDKFGSYWYFLIAENHTNQDILSEKLTKPLKDGQYQWRVCANDGYGVGPWSEVWNFVIDTIPPSSEITFPINNGVYNQLSDNISGSSLDLFKGSGVSRVEICLKRLNDDLFWNGTNWTTIETWISTRNTKVWSYDPCSIDWITDIYYNIRSRAIDNAGNYEIPSEGIIFMYDDKPPDNSIIINNNLKYTKSTHVNLSLTAEDTGSGVYFVSYSTDGISWSAREQFKYTKPYKLHKVDGIKSIFYKVEDRARNKAISHDKIILDTTPPNSLSITINKGAVMTNSTKVTLLILAIDALSGVSHMSFSTDKKTWSSWEDYSNEKSYTLLHGEGIKTVYFMVKDWAGNIAEPISTSIILNTTLLKGEEPTPKNEATKKSFALIYYFYILILIITIILIFILLARRRKKQAKEGNKKELQIQYGTVTSPIQPAKIKLCLNCGKQLSIVPMNNKYYCSPCKKYD